MRAVISIQEEAPIVQFASKMRIGETILDERKTARVKPFFNRGESWHLPSRTLMRAYRRKNSAVDKYDACSYSSSVLKLQSGLALTQFK